MKKEDQEYLLQLNYYDTNASFEAAILDIDVIKIINQDVIEPTDRKAEPLFGPWGERAHNSAERARWAHNMLFGVEGYGGPLFHRQFLEIHPPIAQYIIQSIYRPEQFLDRVVGPNIPVLHDARSYDPVVPFNTLGTAEDLMNLLRHEVRPLWRVLDIPVRFPD